MNDTISQEKSAMDNGNDSTNSTTESTEGSVTESTDIDEELNINVRGTLIILPLHDIVKKDEFLQVISPYYRSSTNQYVLQRNPAVVHNILDYFCGRKFHLPSGFCLTMTEEELTFWNIRPKELELCCLSEFTKQRENARTTAAIHNTIFTSHFPAEADPESVRFKIWRFLEQPSSSKYALLWAILISLSCVISIGILCIESMVAHDDTAPFLADHNGTGIPILSWQDGSESDYQTNRLIGILDMTINALMSLEVILRIGVAYSKRETLTSLFGICDILYIIFTWASVFWVYIVYHIEKVHNDTEVKVLSAVLVLARLLRIPRLFYAIRHSKGLLILAWSVRASLKDIAFLSGLVCIIVTGFGILIYYAEQGSEEYSNIFHGMWWALVTVTTVGYGDKNPSTLPGYIVGVCCAWVGVLTITLTVPIFATHFSNFYDHFNSLYRLNAYKKSTRNHGRKSVLALINSIASKSISSELSTAEKTVDQKSHTQDETSYI